MITPKQMKEVFKSLFVLSCVASSLSAMDALGSDVLMEPPEHWANLTRTEERHDSLGFDALRRATEAEIIEKSNEETTPMDTTEADKKIQDQRDEDIQKAILNTTNNENLPELANTILPPLPMDLNAQLTQEMRKKINGIIEKMNPEQNEPQIINNQQSNLKTPDNYLSALLKSAMANV